MVVFQTHQSCRTASRTPAQDVGEGQSAPLQKPHGNISATVAAPPGVGISRNPNSHSHQSLGMWNSRWRRCSLRPAWPPQHAHRWVNNLSLGTGRKA